MLRILLYALHAISQRFLAFTSMNAMRCCSISEGISIWNLDCLNQSKPDLPIASPLAELCQ